MLSTNLGKLYLSPKRSGNYNVVTSGPCQWVHLYRSFYYGNFSCIVFEGIRLEGRKMFIGLINKNFISSPMLAISGILFAWWQAFIVHGWTLLYRFWRIYRWQFMIWIVRLGYRTWVQSQSPTLYQKSQWKLIKCRGHVAVQESLMS